MRAPRPGSENISILLLIKKKDGVTHEQADPLLQIEESPSSLSSGRVVPVISRVATGSERWTLLIIRRQLQNVSLLATRTTVEEQTDAEEQTDLATSRELEGMSVGGKLFY